MNLATRQIWSRRGVVMLLLLVLLGAWGLRMRGIEWPLLHPDEYKITAWAAWMEEHTRTFNTAYPGGYFHMVKPLLIVKNALLDSGEAWQTFLGHGDQLTRPDMVETFLLRKINVEIALLTIVLVYGLARRISGSRVGALAAAAFLGMSRLHVEHSHYAETDIAMLFTFTLALYLWALVCERRRIGWFLLAAVASGLAIGTKYTNLILLGPLIGGIIACAATGEPERRGRRWVLFIVMGLLAVVTGWLYTNRHVLADADYWSQLSRALHSTYGEQAGLMGKDVGDPYGIIRSNWNTFREGIGGINAVWLAFIATGVGLSLMRRYRRFVVVTALPLVVYFIYFITLAPWVRSQEFMVFLPLFAVFIAMGVREVWWGLGQKRYAAISRSLLAALVAAAVLQSGYEAGRFSSLCGWPEPRIQAMKWIYCHAPLTARVGVEDYTVPACRLFGNACEISQIERVSPQDIGAYKMDYLLRNETARGRGTVDPRTRDLYPEYAENLARFTKEARLLCQWGPQDVRYAFVGNRIEWWDARPVPTALALASPLFRPVRIDETDAISVPMVGSGVGSAAGMMVDTAPRSFVVSGSGASDRVVYVILQTEERGGTVVVQGMGDRQVVEVPPYSVRVVPMSRSWYWPRVSEYDVITVRAKSNPHIRYLPCFAQIALDPTEVSTILYQKGYPDRALSRLAAVPPDSEKEKWLRYVCAVEQSDWALAERLETAARQTLAQFEAVRVLPSEQLAVNGFSGTAYRDHARIRLPALETGRDGIQMIISPMLLRLVKEETNRNFTGTVELPVRLAPGHYSLQGQLSVKPPVVLSQPWSLTLGDAFQPGLTAITLTPSGSGEFTREIVVNQEQSLTLRFASQQAGGQLELSDMELRWRQDDLLWPERRALHRALVWHAFHRGDRVAAEKQLEQARESVHDEAGWQQVAQAAEAVRHPSKAGGAIFYPWLKLVGSDLTDSCCRIRFELLKDGTPPLKGVAYRKKWSGVKHFYESKLGLQNRRRGDVVTMDVPLPKGTVLSDVSLRVEADVEWVSTPLHVRGSADDRVQLEN